MLSYLIYILHLWYNRLTKTFHLVSNGGFDQFMKKQILAVVAVLCILSCLTVSAGAEGADAMQPAQMQEASLPPVVAIINAAFHAILPWFAAVAAKLGAFSFAPYVVLAAALLAVSLFGYRFHMVMRGIIGVTAGLFAGYYGQALLFSWNAVPAFFLKNRLVFQILLIFIGALVVVALTYALRRVGTALAVSTLVTALSVPCIKHAAVYLVVFAVAFVLSVTMTKKSVICLASFASSIFLCYLMLGSNGMYPYSFAPYFTAFADPLLVVGVVAGTVTCSLHFVLARKVR